MPTTEQHEAASRKTSSPASIFSISVLIASLALVFRGGALWFVGLWVGSITALTVVRIWEFAASERKRRLMTPTQRVESASLRRKTEDAAGRVIVEDKTVLENLRRAVEELEQSRRPLRERE